jgi:hypothetical protein
LRFVIGRQYMRQGHGRAAMEKISEYIRTFPTDGEGRNGTDGITWADVMKSSLN